MCRSTFVRWHEESSGIINGVPIMVVLGYRVGRDVSFKEIEQNELGISGRSSFE
jgi:hypothetical protein